MIGSTLTMSCSGTGEIWLITLTRRVAKGNGTAEVADIAHGMQGSCTGTKRLRAGASVQPCSGSALNLTVVFPNVQPDDSAKYICDITMMDSKMDNAKANKDVTIIGKRVRS